MRRDEGRTAAPRSADWGRKRFIRNMFYGKLFAEYLS
jgi:hypothetical protein